MNILYININVYEEEIINESKVRIEAAELPDSSRFGPFDVHMIRDNTGRLYMYKYIEINYYGSCRRRVAKLSLSVNIISKYVKRCVLGYLYLN